MRKILVLLPFVALLGGAKGHAQPQRPAPGYWKLVEKHVVDENLRPISTTKDGKTVLKPQDGGEADFRIEPDGAFFFNDGIRRACKIENGKFNILAEPGARTPETALDVVEQSDDKITLTLNLNGTQHLYVYQLQQH